MCCSQLHLDTYTQKQEIWRENERDLPCSGRGGGGGAFIRSLTGSSSMPFTGGNALIESYCILGSFSWPLTRFLDFMPSSWKNPSKVSNYLPKRNFLFLVKNENKYDLLSSATGCAPRGRAFIRSLTGSSSMPFTGGNALIESYCILGSFSWPLTRFLDFMPSSWKNPSKVSNYLPKRNFLFLVKNENKYDLLSSATGCAPVSPRRKRKQIKEIEAIITGCNWSDKKVLNETIFRIILETSTDWTLK